MLSMFYLLIAILIVILGYDEPGYNGMPDYSAQGK